MLSPALILACVGAYFAILMGIAWVTSRRAGNAAYFLGNRASPWYVVAFGLIGDSLSGVTFISVPGRVRDIQFTYLQTVLGYVLGYLVIAHVLLPLYYRMELTSIYTYLGKRLGVTAQKTGSVFFLASRLLGAAARLYLAAGVAQRFVFEAWGVPFGVTVAIIIGLMLAYTYRGGIKTLVWTDLFQSAFLLLGLFLSVVVLVRELGYGPWGWIEAVRASGSARVFEWDWAPANNFWKEFVGGAFIAVCMTGLDQNMMQKNLSCRSLREAQRNIHWFSWIVVLVNLVFLVLGALLYLFARERGIEIPARTDHLFPTLALQHLGGAAAVTFLLGLTAATFSSADSVLTTLTTSFCIDILGTESDPDMTEARRTRLRHLFHFVFAGLLLAAILVFQARASSSVIALVLKIAGYTYGPLLGLFAFGLLTRRQVPGGAVPWVAVLAPCVCGLVEASTPSWAGGYRVGNELLVLNGGLTFVGLWLASTCTRTRSPR
ncbi:MAG: sodium:solute symporter [Verrucomicrobiales bacterium]|nr:sodium:solute symporter [Verrucomicrobiales bacterium]